MSELGFYRIANSYPDEIAIVEPSEKIWTRGELLAKTNCKKNKFKIMLYSLYLLI